MDNVSDTQHVCTDDSFAFRRLAKGYSLEDLALATGLTIAEIIAAENGNGADTHVERIEVERFEFRKQVDALLRYMKKVLI